jgi:hypothetical protein
MRSPLAEAPASPAEELAALAHPLAPLAEAVKP